MKYTTETYVKVAEEKYPGRFDYSKTIYQGSYTKIVVTCKEHSQDFLVDPIYFIRTSSKGDACPKCRHNKKLSPEEFLEIIKSKYGDLYDFSKTKLITTREEVTVTCYNHGDFSIRAGSLSSNKYNHEICPECSGINTTNSRGWTNWVKRYKDDEELGAGDGVFYKLLFTHKETGIQFIKIGITSYTSSQRYAHSEYKEFDFEVIEEVHDTNLNVALLEEKYIKENEHKRFYIPAYIKFTGRSECYQVDDEYQLKINQVKFIRDGLIKKQNNICPICKRNIVLPTLDHFHSKKIHGTGKVRGVLCNVCNRFVGSIENNLLRTGIEISEFPMIIQELSDYLKNAKTNLIHPSEKEKEPKIQKSCFNELIKKMNKSGWKGKLPVFPSSGKLNKKLGELFKKYNVQVRYLKGK